MYCGEEFVETLDQLGVTHVIWLPDSAFGPTAPVWSYTNPSTFYSNHLSGAQRLPNGNTLITEGTSGHLFEVTPEGEVVWEYINPVTKTFGTVKVLDDAIPMTNAVFRAYRYAPDHPALRGKDLSPKGTITDAYPREPRPDRPAPAAAGTAGPAARPAGESTVPPAPGAWGGWRKEKP